MADQPPEGSIRLSAREKNKPRQDKAQLIQAGRLHGRRENREIDELTAQVTALTGQLDAARTEVDRLKGSAGAAGGSKTDKAVQKELDALSKKVRRLEEERDAAVADKDALATKVSSLESSLALDTRLVKLNADLEAERARVSSHAGKLALAQDESSTFQRRLQQLEKGGETTAEMEMKRQKQQFNEAVSRLEGQVANLEQDKFNLIELVKTSKAKQDQLEDQKLSLERESSRLSTELQKAEGLVKQREQQDRVRQTQAREGACSAEEQTRLKDKIVALEKLCATLEASAIDSSSGSFDSAAFLTVRRYHDLIANLHLSEDDVTTLLDEGSLWPPIRATQPNDTSLIDFMWLLADREAEHDDDKRALEDELAQAKQRADDALAAASGSRRGSVAVGASRSGGTQDGLEKERAAAREDKARDKEVIAQLEARISAYEANASRPERSSSRASSVYAAPTATSGYSQAVVDRLTVAMKDLNQQVADLRDENMSLLLQLAGVEP
ncbi:hypothetical protein JCM3775_001216 [Rhodotorula graminis]